MDENINITYNVLPSVMNFQCRNRRAGGVFDNRYAVLQPVTGGYSSPLPLAVTSNDSLRCRCHHLLHMLDKFCNKLVFFRNSLGCHNARERVMKTLVHISETKRTPTQIKGIHTIRLFFVSHDQSDIDEGEV